MFFELFDLATGNTLEDFATEEDAFEALRAATRVHGPDAISDIALLRYEDGHPTLISMEHRLVERVNQSTSLT